MFQRARQLRKEGMSIAAISKKLRCNRKTIYKYIQSNTPPVYSSRSVRTRKDPLIGFEDKVQKLISTPLELSSEEVFEIIKKDGYVGSDRTLRRRIHIMRSNLSKERFFEQLYVPGEQSQHDFKEEVTVPFANGEETLYLHFSTLPYSNVFGIKAFPAKNYECFIDGIHSFFESIGGMPSNIRIDNLSPCVSRVLKGNNRQYTKAFEAAIKYYGFGVLPCGPGKGNDKGDVERDIRTHAKRIGKKIKLEGRRFVNYSDFNQWLSEYVASRFTDKMKEQLAIEKKALSVIPQRCEDVLCRVEDYRSTTHGTIKLGDYLYSVPDFAIKEPCRVVAGPYDVKIYQKAPYRLVATHPRNSKNSILIEHVISSLVRKPAAMVRWAHRDILFQHEEFKHLFTRLKKIETASAEREFLRTINLIHHCQMNDLLCAINIALEADVLDLFPSVRSLLLVEHWPGKASNNVTPLIQERLQPNLNAFDSLIPKNRRTQE